MELCIWITFARIWILPGLPFIRITCRRAKGTAVSLPGSRKVASRAPAPARLHPAHYGDFIFSGCVAANGNCRRFCVRLFNCSLTDSARAAVIKQRRHIQPRDNNWITLSRDNYHISERCSTAAMIIKKCTFFVCSTFCSAEVWLGECGLPGPSTAQAKVGKKIRV